MTGKIGAPRRYSSRYRSLRGLNIKSANIRVYILLRIVVKVVMSKFDGLMVA